MKRDYFEYNDLILKKMSVFLNLESDFITKEIINELCGEFGMEKRDAFSYILASAVGLDISESERDREIFELYFPMMVRELDASVYERDPYFRSVLPKEKHIGKWELRYQSYKPFEAFVCDDLITLPDGRIIPQIAFFDREYKYPCVLENGREWMLITPNEINTMREPISKAHGRVLTYGLGLGYFAFMCAQKDNVEMVTVVERDESVIELFEGYIRPSIKCASKIKVVQADAYEYAASEAPRGSFDFVFADIWHDASDGVEAYKRFKALEHLMPEAEYSYWIEKTLKVYL